MRIAMIFFLLLYTLSIQAGTLRDSFEDGDSEGWRLIKGRTGASGLLSFDR